MITARRMHERRAQEAAGLPPPAPRQPDEIPFNEHQAVVRELNKAHAAEVNALRKQFSAAGGDAAMLKLADMTEALAASNKAKAEAVEAAEKLAAENAELRSMLEQATAPKAVEASADPPAPAVEAEVKPAKRGRG